jgi:hypothetical protein
LEIMMTANVPQDPQVPKARRGRPAKKATKEIQENKDLQVSQVSQDLPDRKESKDLQVPKENPVNAHVPATTFLLVLITSLVAMTIILAFVPRVLLP